MGDPLTFITHSIFPGGTPVDNESRRNYIIAAVVAAVILIVGYVLYARSGPPTPELGPGQTIEHPFGNVKPSQGQDLMSSGAQSRMQHRVPGSNPGGGAPAAPPGR